MSFPRGAQLPGGDVQRHGASKREFARWPGHTVSSGTPVKKPKPCKLRTLRKNCCFTHVNAYRQQALQVPMVMKTDEVLQEPGPASIDKPESNTAPPLVHVSLTGDHPKSQKSWAKLKPCPSPIQARSTYLHPASISLSIYAGTLSHQPCQELSAV